MSTLVTVPVNWSALDIVKLGYVPLIVVVPLPLSDTTWSGAVLLTVMLPLDVTGPPLTEIPVPAVKSTEVTVPVNWSLVVTVKLG
jgi:hypothetical protein